MKTELYNQKSEAVGTVELPEEFFGAKWRPALVRQVLTALLANKRHPWAHARTRGEVRGGGKKPWRQKGTGRARHGSTRSPIWVGGGKAHGPRNDRDYSQKVNKKMKRAALSSVLSKKLADKEVKVFDGLSFEKPKTKLVAMFLKKAISSRVKNYDVLLVRDHKNQALTRSARNLPKTKVTNASALNIYDLLNHKYVFFEQDALKDIGTMPAHE